MVLFQIDYVDFCCYTVDACGEEWGLGGSDDKENEKLLFFSHATLILLY